MSRITKAFMDELMDDILRDALQQARPRVAAAGKRGTLVKSMEAVKNSPYSRGRGYVEGSLNIPYRFAIYVHEGRPKKQYTKESGVYVFWRNPSEDPRRPGGREPKGNRGLRKLSKTQFQNALALRRQWIEDGNDPETCPVVITKVLKGPTKGIPFFSNTSAEGMLGFRERGAAVIRPRFHGFVQQSIGKDLLRVSDMAVARL